MAGCWRVLDSLAINVFRVLEEINNVFKVRMGGKCCKIKQKEII